MFAHLLPGWPETPPIYDIHKSYQDNFVEGPFLSGAIPPRHFSPQEEWIDFLGYRVASRIGVPAGPLLNGKWVETAARLGFDIVTYKTIRTRLWPAHPVPNMIYVETHGFLSHERAQETLHVALSPPPDMEQLAVTNSFGIPSQGKEFLIQDIAQANTALAPGQLMIVSIVGTPTTGEKEDLVQDFVQCALLALEGGAKVIEADLSCPNVLSCEGSLFTNPEMVYEISRRIIEAIGSIPLILKVGVIQDKEVLREVMRAAARGGARAICGINTISMKIINAEGEPALGKNRLRAGVCGSPIREVALQFVADARSINDEERLDLVIMGTGGATCPEHFALFLDVGADIAMSATGMLWNPYLALSYHETQRSIWNTR